MPERVEFTIDSAKRLDRPQRERSEVRFAHGVQQIDEAPLGLYLAIPAVVEPDCIDRPGFALLRDVDAVVAYRRDDLDELDLGEARAE